ncbi:SDR family oxidoreductase [Arthrobacter sp. UYEF3]|uniref:SDR family oxidoreductase n=1 Tax=Arthrobacter sp. UYEF3 TaxID=1756365 RepID=UPI003397B793
MGFGAARALLSDGHDVVLHARRPESAGALLEAFGELAARAAGVVVGDLSSAAETRSVAEQVNSIGRMDAVIHNAGTYLEPTRGTTPEGHARTLAVNTLAPYLLTALIDRPDRLIYLSSGLHRSGSSSLEDLDWAERRWNAGQAYAESKLYVTAFALAAARRWPSVLSNAVDPGWVPTRMGGPGAPDDLEMGHLTQTWLAASDDPSALTSGGYWHHRKLHPPAPDAFDSVFQERLLGELAELTRIPLF